MQFSFLQCHTLKKIVLLHRASGRQDRLCPSTQHMTGQTLQVRLARFSLTACFYQQHHHKLGHWTTPLQSPSLHPATTPKQLHLPAWSPLIPALCQLLLWETSENQQNPLLCPSQAELLCPFPMHSISDSSEQHKSRGQSKA